MKAPQRRNRKEIGLELRRTHYNLGNDTWNYLSQYRHDYPEHPLSGGYEANMDSVTLRKTHFKLGDFKNPYSTTTMEQSKNIGKRPHSVVELDEHLKNDLRKSHFIMGNAEPAYHTISQQEYYDKSHMKDPMAVNCSSIEKRLRSHNYVLGDDKPDYKSEAQAKYITPTINFENLANPKKISTADLQKSHYVFGTNTDPWVTTQQASFNPKQGDPKLFTKNLTKTNFILGEAEPNFKSVAQETYIPHPIVKNDINKELAQDLRKHHFTFGNENYPDQMTSLHNQDYTDPKLQNAGNTLQKLDPHFLRASHFQLGDPCQQPANHYATTYALTMVPKEHLPVERPPNHSFKSSLVMNSDGPNNYITESKANYVPKNSFINPKEEKIIKNVIHEIKSSHFGLGDMKNDYQTTVSNAYKFDPQAASQARGNLDQNLINDLRATHYKLGYIPEDNRTTHQSAYVPLNLEKRALNDPNLRKTHFDLNGTNCNIQDGRTIYMTDYTKKEIPYD